MEFRNKTNKSIIHVYTQHSESERSSKAIICRYFDEVLPQTSSIDRPNRLSD